VIQPSPTVRSDYRPLDVDGQCPPQSIFGKPTDMNLLIALRLCPLGMRAVLVPRAGRHGRGGSSPCSAAGALRVAQVPLRAFRAARLLPGLVARHPEGNTEAAEMEGSYVQGSQQARGGQPSRCRLHRTRQQMGQSVSDRD